MKKKDNENEYIGIISIIVIVVLAVMMLYYFYSYHSVTTVGADNTNIPVEAPAPPNEATGTTP